MSRVSFLLIVTSLMIKSTEAIVYRSTLQPLYTVGNVANTAVSVRSDRTDEEMFNTLQNTTSTTDIDHDENTTMTDMEDESIFNPNTTTTNPENSDTPIPNTTITDPESDNIPIPNTTMLDPENSDTPIPNTTMTDPESDNTPIPNITMLDPESNNTPAPNVTSDVVVTFTVKLPLALTDFNQSAQDDYMVGIGEKLSVDPSDVEIVLVRRFGIRRLLEETIEVVTAVRIPLQRTEDIVEQLSTATLELRINGNLFILAAFNIEDSVTFVILSNTATNLTQNETIGSNQTIFSNQTDSGFVVVITSNETEPYENNNTDGVVKSFLLSDPVVNFDFTWLYILCSVFFIIVVIIFIAVVLKRTSHLRESTNTEDSQPVTEFFTQIHVPVYGRRGVEVQPGSV